VAKVIRKDGPGKALVHKIVAQAQARHILAGFLASAIYESGIPVAYVAAIMEYGCPAKNIPPRPIFGPTVDRCEATWRELAKRLGQAVLQGKLTPDQALEQLGLAATGDLAETLINTNEPPLAERTIINREYKKRRGFPVGSLTKPLQESGYMLSQITTSGVQDGLGEDA